MMKMKDSGIEWIGLVPNNWKVRSIRADFCEVTEKNKFCQVRNALKFTYGCIVPKENFDSYFDDYIAETILNYTVVEPDTIILNGLNLNFDFVTQRIGLVKEKGIITSAYMAFKAVSHDVFAPYVAYLFKSYDNCKAFHNMGGGVRKILNYEELKKKYYLMPPIIEQYSIASYLDAQCSEIDSLISDIHKQIDTLEEYKRSVITEAVTKGLNPDVDMNDSGIDYIGKMNSTWKLTKLRYICNKLNRYFAPNAEALICSNKGEVFPRGDNFFGLVSDNDKMFQGVRKGDLLIHGMDTWHGAIAVSDYDGKCTTVVHVCESEQNKYFICYFLQMLAFKSVYKAISNGVRENTSDFRSWDKTGHIHITLPTIDEQNKIADYIKDKVERINDIITEKKQQITTIEEYKKSLIFEYVTGKKEVPSQTVIIDPKVILAGTILNKLGANLKGKIQVQKIMYLCETMLGLPLQTQYFRYPHGPYDKNIDTYLAELNSKQWFIIQDNSPMTCCKGDKFSDLENEHLTAFSEYNAEIEKIVSFIAPMKTSQAERIATLFAVWNDFIIDGVINPSDEQIINEVVTKWTPNKANSETKTWKGTLDKMKKNGIIPKGFGKHTQPKDI